MEPATATEARRFGKYTLVAKLATGGMAEIFLARLHGDGGFEKLVCIKRILPHLAKDPQFVAMFLDEARVAARISHPNVCQVFELGEWEGQYYIAMEYLEGVPLSVFRRKDFYPMPPDPRLVAAFGVQACEGLHHAHQLKREHRELLGVVHRDISPQNLFATTDGIVKVLDFGIAKVQDATVRTSTGAVKGTYAYMAPEQLRNEHLDRRVDVWALGAVLWETLAQRHLFKRDTEFLTFEAITTLPIPDICEVRPDVPPLLGDTIARALSRNPDDRFASARALGEALAQAVAPLGGIASSAAISDEVSQSFEAMLAEQRMLLRIAREGGQFDLETSSPLVAHGTSISTTPVSSIQRRVEEAQAEVAHFVAATQAIDSLYEDELREPSRSRRFATDGAFTPAPSRRSAVQEHQADPESGVVVVPARRSPPHAAERPSGPDALAPADSRQDDTETPAVALPVGRSAATPVVPARGSKLPWLVAIVAIATAAATVAVFYVEHRMDRRAAPVAASEPGAPAGGTTQAGPAQVAPAPAGSPAVGATSAPVAGQEHATPAEDASPGQAAPPNREAHAPPGSEQVVTADPREKTDKRDERERAEKRDEHERTEKRDERERTEKRDEHERTERSDSRTERSDSRTDNSDSRAENSDRSGKTEKGDRTDKAARADKRDRADKQDDHADKTTPGRDKAVAGPPGFITIDSTPVYAVIYIDGKKLGETPLVNLKLAPGKHSVRAVSPSGSTQTLTIHIEPGKTAPVRRIEW